ncbi:unnamed protein product [Anisakis simplex]|uniref:Edg1 TPR repeats region domain-containing protein n=1 Tax=Anisakis simplex TaxID=6269 RepID=A0A3P6TJ02_ANISI|nr:unnamed protein product [Anisakis simplex]
MPAVVELKLELNKVERSNSTQQIPLITLALRELVLSRSVWLENAETSSCFIYLIQSLVKERYAQVKPNREEQSKRNESADNKEEQQSQEHEEGTTDKSTQDKSSKKYGEVLDCAVLNSSELLMDLILPWMFASNGAEIALDLLARILADYETKRTPIEWNIEIREDDPQRANLYERFPVALCIKLLVDIVCHYGNDDDGNGGDKNATKRDRNESNALVVQSLALKCLANLGEKLKRSFFRSFFSELFADFAICEFLGDFCCGQF